jgi:hypothetical protein
MRFVAHAARSGEVRSATRAAFGRWPVSGWIAPSDVYSGFGLITAVPSELLPAQPDAGDIDKVRQKTISVAPATLVLGLRLPTSEAETRIEEIYLEPLGRSGVDRAKDLTAIIHSLPGAGGRGEEAQFEIWHKGGLNVSVPLLASAIRSGGDVTQPVLRPGDGYGVMLSIYPDKPGLYEYRLRARCRRENRVWSQPLDGTVRLLVLEPKDHADFAGAVTLLFDKVDKVLPRFPDQGLRGRMEDVAWGGRPALPKEAAFLVRGRSVGRSQ